MRKGRLLRNLFQRSERGSLGRYHLSWNFKEVKEPTRRWAGRAAEADGCEDRFQAGERLLG